MFDNYGDGEAQSQEDHGECAAYAECLRNDVDADNSGNRYEDKAIEYLPRNTIFSAHRVDYWPEKQGEDTEC